MALRTISLCSGVGGLDLGLDEGARRAGFGGARAVCMVEGEAFAAATLAAQMESGGLAPAPIWSDLHTFDARPWRGVVDLVVGGYPCQPFSLAGGRLGADDPRHLWPAVARVVRECAPALCFFENVGGHLSLGGREVISELQSMGYRVACSLWTAEEVGAPHRRERLFILAAHPERVQLRQQQGRGSGPSGQGAALAREHGETRDVADSDEHAGHERGSGDAREGARGRDADRGAERANVVADADGAGLQGWSGETNGQHGRTGGDAPPPRELDGEHPWATEPDVGRSLDGFASWLDAFDMTMAHELVLANGPQAVRALRDCHGALAIQREIRGRGGVSPEAVLLTYLRKLEERTTDEARVQLARSEASEEEVRGLRARQEPARAPHRSGPCEQLGREHSDTLQVLSRLLAHDAEAAWVEYSRTYARAVFGPDWELGLARVAHGVPDRVDRLRAIGNGVVPAQAAAAFVELWEALT